jgi:hypothetical protein
MIPHYVLRPDVRLMSPKKKSPKKKKKKKKKKKEEGAQPGFEPGTSRN